MKKISNHFFNKTKNVLRAVQKIPNKKTLKFHLELNFNNFEKNKKLKVLQLIVKTFSLLGLTLLNSMPT